MLELAAPRGPGGLSATWLTAALSRAGLLRDCPVISFTAEPLPVAGLLSRVVRVRLSYGCPGMPGPRTLVAKFSVEDGPEHRDLAALTAAEIRAYDELIAGSPLPAPRLYFAATDAEFGSSVLLLEDLAGHRVIRQVDGCDPDQAHLAIRVLARFHAHWWGRTDPGGPALLAALSSWPIADQERDLLSGVSAWPAAAASLAPALVAAYDRLRAALCARPRTAIHGDFHSQNLLFAGPSAERPLVVVDFQRMAAGRGAVDVARFLATSLLPSVRRAIERELVGEYLAVLEAEGVRDYSAAECLDDVRRGLLWDLLGRLALARRRMAPGDERWPRAMPIVERCMEAIRDWDAEGVLG